MFLAKKPKTHPAGMCIACVSLTNSAEGTDLSSVVPLNRPPTLEPLDRVREHHSSIARRLGLAPQPSARRRAADQALEVTPAADTWRTEAGGSGRDRTFGQGST